MWQLTNEEEISLVYYIFKTKTRSVVYTVWKELNKKMCFSILENYKICREKKINVQDDPDIVLG